MIESDTTIEASLTDDTSSVNYNRNMFIIQATVLQSYCDYDRTTFVVQATGHNYAGRKIWVLQAGGSWIHFKRFDRTNFG